jgi:hypothetical protein
MEKQNVFFDVGAEFLNVKFTRKEAKVEWSVFLFLYIFSLRAKDA